MVKKPKLTPEQKEQLRREQLLAKKLAKEEQKRQVKRDYLARELRYGQKSRKKLEKSWTKMLVAMKLPVLQAEFQLAVNNAERLLDSKDFQISYLLDELDEAEDQYNMNFKAHVDNAHKIMEIFHLRLDDLKHKYENEYSSLMFQTNKEMNVLKQKLNNESEHLGTMIYRLDYEKKDMDKELRCAYLSKLNEEASKNIHEIGFMSLQKERAFENIWNLFKNTLSYYTSSTAQRRKETDVLFQHTIFVKNLINEQALQLSHLQHELCKINEQQTRDREDLVKYVDYKLEERNYFAGAFETLRKQLEVDCKYDKEQLTNLVITSNDTIKILESQAKHSESVIKLYAITQKRETPNEKLLPFPKSFPAVKQKTLNLHLPEFSHYIDLKEMDAFWMKCGQGDASRNIINEEREYLKKENNYLKRYIETYCFTCVNPRTDSVAK